MSFDIIELNDENYLITGTDVRGNTGEDIVCGRQWNAINRRFDTEDAKEEMNSAIEEFFQPLTTAVDSFNRATEIKYDELAYIVIEEGTEGVEERSREVVHLTRDSQILRAIYSDETDRLLWVNGSLVITAAK